MAFRFWFVPLVLVALLASAAAPIAIAAGAADPHAEDHPCKGGRGKARLYKDAKAANVFVLVETLCAPPKRESAGTGGVPLPADGCSAPAYSLSGHRWASPFSGRFDARGSGLDAGAALDALRASAATWDAATAARVIGTLSEGGDGSRAGVRDGVNQLGFRALGSGGTVAQATTWFRSDGTAFESDVAFNTYYAWSTTGAGGRADFQSVATHELGHSLGLGHPPDSTANACLTMYYRTQFGTTALRTLGVGDVLGIQKLYGAPPAPPPPAPLPPPVAFAASFAPKPGNAWWVETRVEANQPLAGVAARVNGGAPVALALTGWGTWARSFHVPEGALVSFVATSTEGATVESGRYVWPAASPAGSTAFSATFTKHAAGEWWVEVRVSANAPLAGVEARANGGEPVALQPTKWGTWARSFHVPAGSRLVFTAVSADGERTSSDPMAWP